MAKVALISDIHGNYTALKAVLADISEVGVDAIYSSGRCRWLRSRATQCMAEITKICEPEK